MYYNVFSLLSPHKKECVYSFEKLETPSSEDALLKVWLRSTCQSTVRSLHIYSYLQIWERIVHFGRGFATIGWNWPNGAGEEDFHNLLLFFTTGIWLLFPMLKRRVVFHLNSLQTLMLCAKFVWKRMKMWKVDNDNDGQGSSGKGCSYNFLIKIFVTIFC